MRLRIFHTNDIHSNFDFLKRVHAYLAEHKREEDFYFDSGDFSDLKNLITHANYGVMGLKLLSSTFLDTVSFGNNELDQGLGAIEQLLATAAPIVTTNLRKAGLEQKLDLLSPKILEEIKGLTAEEDLPKIPDLASSFVLERAGKRFLILGLVPYYAEDLITDSYNSFFLLGNLRTINPIKALRDELEKRKGQFDFVILLSHSGYLVDQKILREIPEIDCCLGGHCHHVISEGKYSQSGRGEYLGMMTLEVDEVGIRIVGNEQIDLPEQENPAFDRLYGEVLQESLNLLSDELEMCEELDFDPFAECTLINFICDALLKEMGGDLALMHHGIAEGPLKSPLSKQKLIECFPSKLNPTLFPVKGSDLQAAVKQSFLPEIFRQEGKGAGFRGKVLGTLGFSHNVRVRKEPFSLQVDGQEVEDDRMYMLAADDYLQRGTGYSSLRTADRQSTYHRYFICDLVEEYLSDQELFSSAKVKRTIY